jgi:hypothetical protein
MHKTKPNRIRNIFKWFISGLGVLIIVLVAISALSNIGLPTHSQVIERLSEVDKARISETIHLRKSLGNIVFPGWGDVDIPLIVYNEKYAFLVGYPQPPDGWIKIPSNSQRGGPWEAVIDDNFEGQTYFRQKLPANGDTPEAFTVMVGERWVASMQTFEWMKISLANQFRQDLPGFLKPVFPYRLAVKIFFSSSDQYITSLLHESFHAYQGLVANGRLESSEKTNSTVQDRYPWSDEKLQADWQKELDLLVEAVQAPSDQRMRELAMQFLTQREARRTSNGLSQEFIRYEQQREWLEGMAKYSELEIWREAATTPGYSPEPVLSSDPDFKGYKTFESFYNQQIQQTSRMANDEGDGRFYYTGMTEAILLDRLKPDWKQSLMSKNVYLEDLLQQALTTTS